MITGGEIEIFGDGSQRRDFTYVDDAVQAFVLAAAREEADGQVYNLGGLDTRSLRELAELLVEINGGGSFRTVPFPPDREAIDIGDFFADYSKIERELGWVPRIRLREGLDAASPFTASMDRTTGEGAFP